MEKIGVAQDKRENEPVLILLVLGCCGSGNERREKENVKWQQQEVDRERTSICSFLSSSSPGVQIWNNENVLIMGASLMLVSCP